MCKEFVEGKNKDVEKHLIECYKGRPQCGICRQNFRLRSYLIKHERLVHNLNTGKPAESVSSGSSTSGKKQIKINSVVSGSSKSGKKRARPVTKFSLIQIGRMNQTILLEMASQRGKKKIRRLTLMMKVALKA